MKKFKILFILLVTFRLGVNAQQSGVTITDPHPMAGKELTIIYDPSGTPLAGKTDIQVTAYYWNNANRCLLLKSVTTEESGKKKITFLVPESSKALIFRPFSGTVVDNNHGEGYMSPLYDQSGQPVKEAWMNIATVYADGNTLTDIKANQKLTSLAVQKEISKYPESKKDFATLYYGMLNHSTNNKDKILLKHDLDSLSASSSEELVRQAINLYGNLKRPQSADSLKALAIKRFPKGSLASNDKLAPMYKEDNPEKKEALYLAWVNEFPPKPNGDNINYDYARSAVADAFAQAGNVPKALNYINMVETEVWEGNAYSGLADIFLKNNHLKEAENLIVRAIDNSNLYRTTKSNEKSAGFAAGAYYGLHNTYAAILYKQKRYDEALKNIQIAYEGTKEIRGGINENYAQILQALRKDKEAFEKIDEAVKAGQGTATMKDNLKSLYVKVKGSENGYDAYLESLNKTLAAKFLKQLPGQMISVSAPAFMLTDLNGNKVSLADLKGKIVIVDFWATWCGPCKASFPAMQMAVNKYKDDPNVKFLFIHTWERGEDDATLSAKKYITEQKYSFQVLMDLKDKATGTNKVIESFNVSGIPTKFVIDKNGIIRFRLTGFAGGNDAAVEELSAMIELARKAGV